MSERQAPLFEMKPVAMYVDRGTIVTQEFVSPDGRVMAGYRAIPDAAGFPAWTRQGSIVAGFRETDRQWFATVEAARAWVFTHISAQQALKRS